MDIFASKLFKSSSRQDKIRAAANDPINVELVKQISNYIDPEYQDELKQAKMEEDMKDPEPKEDSKSDESEFDEGFEPSSSSGSSFPSTPTGANGKFDMPDDLDSEPDSDAGASDSSEQPDDEVSEATDINSDIEEDPVKTISDNISTLKDILSSKDDIARIQVKENSKELWIYYNDKTNLNSIMENVISELSNSEYNNLSFNRLARTENAIVFSIDDYLE